MGSYGWLHLTDLHWGMASPKSLWPKLRQKFFDDIRQLHEESGGWDLVIFTGDLVQRGAPEQFEQLDALLLDLWALFEECGSHPAFLAIPGNHDLLRPNPRDPEVLLLRNWTSDIQQEFWSDAKCRYRQTVHNAFKEYQAWWDAQTLRPATIRNGLLPGDFSASVESKGVKLGILGLNTTFLQLAEGDYSGKLAIHAQQFQDACGGDGPNWARQHDACLLLTHQPPDWLTAESRLTLISEIADTGQFAVHLFGHMHEALYSEIAIGGGGPRRTCQGRSLFGLEYFGPNGSEILRSHGYSAGRIDLLDATTGSFRLWPRVALRGQDGTWKIVPDQSYTLVNYVHTKPTQFPLLRQDTSRSRHAELLNAWSEKLRQIRTGMLAGSSTRELRESLYQVQSVLESLSSSDPHRSEAQALEEDIRSAMSAQRTLEGFRLQ
jgi:predicted MPP superfamily phosphohydrolase